MAQDVAEKRMKRVIIYLVAAFMACSQYGAKATNLSSTEILVCDTLESNSLEYCRSRNAEAMIYYNNGQYSLAVDIFRELMEYDYPPAITNFGIACMNGAGVKQNVEKAFECFCGAATMGEPTAQQHLGAMYALGVHVEQNDSASFYWFCYSAARGNTKAISALGEIYLRGERVDTDTLEQRAWLRRFALAGNLDALFVYGVHLEAGTPDFIDTELGSGHHCIYRAAHKGYMPSMSLLMKEALHTDNYRVAYKWAEMLHDKGDPNATKVLADCHYYGRGTYKSKKTAKKLYKLAAENGCAEAAVILDEW